MKVRHVKNRALRLTSWLALAAFCVISACSDTALRDQSSEPTVRGQALDIETGKPLADAHVIARYIGTNGMWGHSDDVCRRIEYMKTGADGYYTFPNSGQVNLAINVFKAGYQAAPAPFVFQERQETVEGKRILRYYVFPRDPQLRAGVPEKMYPTREAASHAAGYDDAYFKRFSGTPVERLKELWRYVSSSDCLNARERRKNVVPYLSALYAEMSTLAVTVEEKSRLRQVADIIESERTAR